LLVRLHADRRPGFVAPRRDLDGALTLIAAAMAAAQNGHLRCKVTTALRITSRDTFDRTLK
jgi:hypothetical protein